MSKAPRIPTDERGYTRSEIIQSARQALDSEISGLLAALKSWGGDQPKKFVSSSPVDALAWRYSLELDSPVHPPEQAGVEVGLEGLKLRGSVEQVSGSGRQIIVSLDKPLPPDATGSVSFDVTRILQALSNRLAALEKTLPDDLPQGVLDPWLGLGEPYVTNLPLLHPISQTLNIDQQQAIMTALGTPASFVFGPPGTGKTRTLGALVAEMAESRGLRVLVLAHTNVAIDTALSAVAASVDASWRDHAHIMRSGYTNDELASQGVGRADFLSDRPPDTEEEQERVLLYENDLSALERALGLSVGSGLPLRARLALISSRDISTLSENDQEIYNVLVHSIQKYCAQYLQTVPVVGATLSWLALHAPRIGTVDAVVIDEAGMAMLPQSILAATVASQSITAFGDPKQLPPLTQAMDPDARQTLMRHPFAQAGVADPREPDARRPLLTIQYRMRPQIGSLVSRLFYGNTLQDAPERIAGDLGQSLWLIDTTRAGTKSMSVGRSRKNPGSAVLVAQMVKYLTTQPDNGPIAILTPFKAQMKEIQGALQAAGLARSASVHTIHRVQGGEFHTVILDLVDTPPNFGTFLQEHLNPDLPHLMCVALSRAKERLFVFAHDQGFRQRMRDEDALMIRLLDALRAEGLAVSPTAISLPFERGQLKAEADSRPAWSEGYDGIDDYSDSSVWVEPA